MKVTTQEVCTPGRVARYMAVRKPQCNRGLGCPRCWAKYDAAKNTGRDPVTKEK